MTKAGLPLRPSESGPLITIGTFVQEAHVGRASSRQGDRLPELDGIRGIAILVVLAYHGFAWSMQNETCTGIPRVVELLTRPGWMGVDLFFVLSGFLITGILLDSRSRPHYFKNFYSRRALRILPLYYAVLVLIAIFYRGSTGYVLLSTFYLSNMADLFGVAVVYGPLWSLSVEEHFYLFWPWLVSRLKPPHVGVLAASILLAEPVLRGIAHFHRWDVAVYTWFRLDGLALGAVLALFVRSEGYTPRRLFKLGIACLGGAAARAIIGIPFGLQTRKTLAGDSLLYTFCSLTFAGSIAVVLSGSFPSLTGLMRSRLLRWCGSLSYCLYIIHWLIFSRYDALVGKYPPRVVAMLGRFGAICIRAVAVYVITFILGELSRRYFEGPVLRLKRFFAYV
jgi:peptidoglycan/LPS O-acetylase OafA/YrhL